MGTEGAHFLLEKLLAKRVVIANGTCAVWRSTGKQIASVVLLHRNDKNRETSSIRKTSCGQEPSATGFCKT